MLNCIERKSVEFAENQKLIISVLVVKEVYAICSAINYIKRRTNVVESSILLKKSKNKITL